MKTATKETTITLPAKAFWEMVKACENLKEYERLWNPLLERARGAELALEAYKRDTEITIANYEGQISAYEKMLSSPDASNFQSALDALNERADQLPAEILAVQ
jgi:hypothetical protein